MEIIALVVASGLLLSAKIIAIGRSRGYPGFA